MSTTKHIIIWSIPLVIAFGSANYAAAKTGEDLLIEKLERVQLNLAPQDTSRLPITLRLADLYAERARKESMAELDQGCTKCVAGKSDREKALNYYSQVVEQLPADQKGRVMIQMGHLSQLIHDEAKAEAYYQKVVAANVSPRFTSEALLALGEIAFKKRNYSEALKRYDQVIKTPTAQQRGLAAYRRAWCLFNLNQIQEATLALKHVLNSPELLTRGASTGGVQVDEQFQEEVSRDLVTFAAQSGNGVDTAKEIYRLSPEKTKMANVSYFAKELERLGKSAQAMEVWRFALDVEKSPYNRLEGLILLSDLEKGQGQLEQAQKDFASALQLWGSVDLCKSTPERCAELKSRLRKFVIDWNRVEKEKPSEGLLLAYENYLKVFPNEKDMTVWAAQVANQQQKYDRAYNYNAQALDLITGELKNADTNTRKALSEEHDNLLLAQIGLAEKMDHREQKLKAYDQYLNSSLLKKNAFEVRYQKAHDLYEHKDYERASLALRELAVAKDGTRQLRTQAAELALDALVVLKKDQEIESWSKEFAQLFPENAGEFTKVASTSILNQTAQIGDSNLEQAWATLNRFNPAQAPDDQKLTYYKNKMVLAEKLNRHSDVRVAADKLLALPNVDEETTQLALGKKAWASELLLDFPTAFELTKKIHTKGMPEEDRNLRLAFFAELSQMDPKPFYKAYIQKSKDKEKISYVAAKLIKESPQPLKDFEVHQALITQKEVLSQAALWVYEKSPQPQTAKKLLTFKSVEGTPAAKILSRALVLSEVEPIKRALAQHQIRTDNQTAMGKDLVTRIQLLENLEKLAGRSVQSGDWTSQVLTLSLLSEQSDRFYKELIGLPMPDGLSPEQQQEYMGLLGQKASPHQLKAQESKVKVDELWKSATTTAAWKESLDDSQGALRQLVLSEVRQLVDYAPEALKADLKALASTTPTSKNLPQLAEVEKVRKDIQKNPNDLASLKTLIDFEKSLGREEIASYYQSRLSLLQEKQTSTQPRPTSGDL